MQCIKFEMDISGLVNGKTSTTFSSTKQEIEKPSFFLAGSIKKDSPKNIIKETIVNTRVEDSKLEVYDKNVTIISYTHEHSRSILYFVYQSESEKKTTDKDNFMEISRSNSTGG